MDVIISFDTEDFITPESMEAQLYWAEMLSRNKIRGSFQCVGEMVRKWQRLGRQDIIDAIGAHEICYHTNYHSLHPEHPEALEDLNLADGLVWVRQREASGLQTIRECFNREPEAFTPSGDSWTPATLLHMAEQGISVATDVGFAGNGWYCGMLMKSYVKFKGTAGWSLFKKGSARLTVGDHPRLQALKDLDKELQGIGDGLEHYREFSRPIVALYVGGMGARDKNFYNELFASYGYEKEAAEIQDLYLDGKKQEAAAAVPQSFLDDTSLVGAEGFVKDRLVELKESGVNALNVVLAGNSTKERVATLDSLRNLLEKI